MLYSKNKGGRMKYRAYHRQIVGNVVAYIADRYFQEKKCLIDQMLLYQILAFFDFKCVTKLGKPCTELDFRARKVGPVPEELYNDKKKSKNHNAIIFATMKHKGRK